MRFCYTHRSMPCPANIREVPSFSDPQINMERVRNFRTLSPKRDIFIKSLPSRISEPRGRGGRESVRARGDGGHQESKTLKINKIKVHMNSEGLRKSAPGVLRK